MSRRPRRSGPAGARSASRDTGAGIDNQDQHGTPGGSAGTIHLAVARRRLRRWLLVAALAEQRVRRSYDTLVELEGGCVR